MSDTELAESSRAGGKCDYEEYLQKNSPIFLFLSELSLLDVKVSKAYN